ncbi:MAG TPA: UvrD-helicase domain-containing protein [Clostridia bacterium]|nr:UvrD-helicase domain-containing protein [Clostridia bacterium]
MSTVQAVSSTAFTDKYLETAKERERHVDAVLTSASDKKVVVAGPGTGKTFLFKKVLEGKTNALTLTFVNALVEDLSLDLFGLSEVRTLHSFARGLLAKITKKEVKISPRLSEIVKNDAQILLGKEIDFDAIFNNRDDENELIRFFAKRKQYYGQYGYSDVIFAAVRYLEKNRGAIPAFEQIVVDEFQDFNQLEVSLIDLLAERSPVLIAGDDDQALYDFKSASARHIRERHANTKPDYAAFSLPFCSRCTRVIVGATNDIITAAKTQGLLKGRIEKAYRYFDAKGKDEESDQSPQLIHRQVFASQIPWIIEKEITAMALDTKAKFSVLVISPTRTQSRTLAASLQTKGFSNLELSEKRGDRQAETLDALRLLLENAKDNLGWRILIKFLLEPEKVIEIVGATDKDATKPIYDLVGRIIRADVRRLVGVVKAIKAGKTVKDEDLARLLEVLDLGPYELTRRELRRDIGSDEHVSNSGIRKIAVKTTTVQSSKGLAADLVFITHFDDQFFVKDKDKKKISDQDVCKFLVALTRAKKRVVLISSTKKDPTFLNWIQQDRVDRRK